LFAKLVEAHALRAKGDVEGARKIMKEILPMHVFPHEGAFKHGLRLMKGAAPQTP
jgi:dihydrodipicolinate synthase/N-acetylneuraminate lyase